MSDSVNGVGTKLPPLNEKLIACVLEHIETHREEWDQSEWLRVRGNESNEWCGTTGCFAGWAVALSTPANQWPPSTMYVRRDAARLLGITDEESLRLFSGANSLEDIKRYLQDFRKARGLPPEPPASEVPDGIQARKET